MEVDKPQQKKNIYICPVCSITCWTPVHLDKHVLGRKHKRKMKSLYPKIDHQGWSLQCFLDTYVKEDPVLGLEHVVEVQLHKYLYICHLCSVIANREGMILHLYETSHLKRYLDKHHPGALDSDDKLAGQKKTEEADRAIRCSAFEIFCKYGRKVMSRLRVQRVGPPPAKVAKYASSTNDLPSKSSHLLRNEAAEESWENLNHRPFDNIDEFLAYMRDLEIQNDEDATFVKNIVQNCNKVLEKFQGKQANVATVQGSPATGRHAPVPPVRADTERVSHRPETVAVSLPSASQCTASTSLGPEPAEQSDATELFFSYIKKMEVSQVFGVLEYFTTTHPEFRGINIPDIIKYLQETGRLKKS